MADQILPYDHDFHGNRKGFFTCRKSATWHRLLYFPSEGGHVEDFFARKIRRLRPGLNPRTRVPEARMLTTRPPKILCCIVAILLSTAVAVRLCELGELSSGGILKYRTPSFKCHVDHSHTMYSSGNIDVRNLVHLF
jgi:hypothetical protein